MKMKRLMHYLSILELLHMLFLASAGVFAAELFKESRNLKILVTSAITTIVLGVYLLRLHSKTKRKTSKRHK